MPWVDLAPANAIGTEYAVDYTHPADFKIEAEMIEEPAVGHNVYFWLSLPQRQSVKYYKGPWIAFDCRVAAPCQA